MTKILVMGLPGSGKTHLSERLQKSLSCAWYNADTVRAMANDWDFSAEGRLRQAGRMMTLANYERSNDRTVICDFVCPTKQMRNIFNADITIWMDTIKSGRFDDTNKMFEEPKVFNIRIDSFLSDEEIETITRMLKEDFYV
jgi:adenylylsulfate kinase